jgi:ATP-dependent Clp protease protease subunit
MTGRETGQPYEKVAFDTDRNYWMNVDEAIAYGMCSRMITSSHDL